MTGPIAAVALVAVVLSGLVGALYAIGRRHPLHPEVSRKLVHVGMGLVVLSFPWLFASPAPVIALGAVSVAALAALRWVPGLRTGPGSVLHSVPRHSYGELSYPVAVAIIFALKGDQTLLYTIPILVLTLADAVAAIIGITYGRLHYEATEGRKTAEGSLAFFTVAFFSVHVPLLLLTDIGRPETLLIATLIGLLVMIVEAVSWQGLDNLFVPVFCYALLRVFWHKPAEMLVARLIVLVCLLIFAVLWRRRTTLSDAALLGATLFGYACWALGGAWWLGPPVLFFLGYRVRWPALAASHHDLGVVGALTTPALFWLVVAVHTHNTLAWLPFVTVFSGHFALAWLSWLRPDRPLLSRLAHAALCAVWGWTAVFVPAVLATLVASHAPLSVSGGAPLALVLARGLGSTALSCVTFFALVFLPRRPGGIPEHVHRQAACAVFFASIVAYL